MSLILKMTERGSVAGGRPAPGHAPPLVICPPLHSFAFFVMLSLAFRLLPSVLLP
ncbi:hypothetical protein BLL52_4290 [Rhodoferax antarcticus ANT.BR]|uniref:Uncharacterized protein n=1 Tax=Rhodoferax antarcticus ANT.BR TaxID=1111071 RepID=A0A1Q8Y8Z0_9BURK|nr:hypothetical protein BLL52_4290 [Rhodoferax antarcticus ANT.BR]